VPAYRRPSREKLAALERFAREVGAGLHILPGCPLIELARSRLEAAFMASGAARLLWMDDDVTVSPADIRAMAAEDLDILGAAYRDRHDPKSPRWNVRISDDADAEDARLDVYTRPSGRRVAPVLGLGFGCLLVKRAVVEAMWARFPELTYVDDATTRPAVMTFMPMIEDRRFLGEDLAWCTRARAAGFQPCLLLDVTTEHAGVSGCFGDAFVPAPAQTELSDAG
jgi:hypothetical protein